MQIVIVCDFGEVNGGAAKVAIMSARGLAEAGLSVIFVCAIGPISKLLDHPRIVVRCLDLASVWTIRNPLSAALQGIWNRHARRALEEILAPLPRDETIVHFHQWTKAMSPSVLLAPLRYGMKAAISLHDYFIACPNGAYYHYQRAIPCRLTPMSGACIAARCDRSSYAHKLVRVARQWATARALARGAAALSMISVSPFAEKVVDRFIPQQHARFVVTSPVQIAREKPVAVVDNTDLVFVGRLTEEKGVRTLAEIAHAARLPLVIVGEGPLLSELQQLGGSVRCTGWLDASGVNKILRRSRALIFPSSWYETGGLVVLEALAQGIPAIVARKTAPADVVADKVSGYVIDPADRAALLDRMRKLTETAVAARMGAEAYRRYWSTPRTLGAHTVDLLAVYRTILAGSAADIGNWVSRTA